MIALAVWNFLYVTYACIYLLYQLPIKQFCLETCICSSELQKRTKDLTQKIALEEAMVRRSTRVRAPPRENPANAFLRYVNKWKED